MDVPAAPRPDTLDTLCALPRDDRALLVDLAGVLARADGDLRAMLRSQLHIMVDAATGQSDLNLRRRHGRLVRIHRRENGTIDILT
jgi:uncharacterized protein YfaQ (DUF2300 family)